MEKLLATLIFIAAAPAYAQFEGVIEMKMTGGDGQHAVNGNSTVMLGKPGMRMQMHMDMGNGGAMDMVTLHNFKEPTLVYQLNEADKTYSVMDTKKMGAHQKERKYVVKKLGSEKCMDYKCTHVSISDDGGNQDMELWTTKDLGMTNWEKMMGMSGRGGMASNEGMMAALKAEGADGFIMKMKGKSREGKGEMVMEVTKVDKKTLPASMFEVPSDYKKNENGTGGKVTLPPDVQKKIDEQMKNMTPEQREAFQKAMQQHH